MKTLVAALAACLMAFSGCSTDSGRDSKGPPPMSDCARGVLFEGGEYVERGFVDQVDQVVGTGSLATCDDASADAEGLVFTTGGKHIKIWSLPDTGRNDGVAMKVGDRYAVLLNQGLSESRRAELIDMFGLEG